LIEEELDQLPPLYEDNPETTVNAPGLNTHSASRCPALMLTRFRTK
jgi:hypothetical protein